MIFPFFHVNKNLTTTHLATKNGLNSNQPSRFVWGSMFGRFQPTKRGASGWSSRTVGKELAWKCPSAISGQQPLDGIGGWLGIGVWLGKWPAIRWILLPNPRRLRVSLFVFWRWMFVFVFKKWICFSVCFVRFFVGLNEGWHQKFCLVESSSMNRFMSESVTRSKIKIQSNFHR